MDSCLTVKNQLPGSDAIPSSSTFNFQDENNADESGSEIESGDEDEVQSSEESDSSSGGESENCPICLLKFKGQAIGFPEVCGHPFCLDCILEWTKNVQTCPNDRQQFNNILVRLDLDGEVVRKIPVQIQNKDEDDVLLEVTECQVCGNSEREDMMLLCDRCDQGYHMDCLVPALEEVPIEDWFCPRCNGHDAVAAPVRQRANLAMRVRRAVQRNRQIALRDSSVGRKRTRKVTKRKSTSKRKSTGKGKQSVGRKKRKVRRKGKGKRRKAAAVPTPRKRIASALVQSDKSFGIQKEPASQFSLFGNPNALDEPADDDSDDEIRRLCSPIKETKSLIAKLAESRKVKKSIYDFGPVALSSAKPGKPFVAATSSVSSANPDLLGSILASQVQLSEFGKPPDAARTKIRAPSNSSRVLAAILASRATLDRLDEDIARLQSSSQYKPIAAPSKDVDQRSGRQQSSDQQGNQSSNNSNNRQQSTGGNSSTNQSNATESNGQTGGPNGSSSNNCGANGGSDGNGDDPNRNQKKKVDSGPKENDAVDDNDKEEDVDLYSDIESVEEEPDLTQNQQTSKAEQEDERMLEDDDEKGLVIDDTEESGRQSTESLSDAKSGNADSRLTEESSEQVEKKEECVPAEGTLLIQAKAVAKKATVEKSQHGGLPAAAAALSVGPRGGVVTRPQLRPRTTQSSVNNSMMNQLMKDNLISSIASALKEQLTSAFRAQAQSESLASSEDSLPAPSYSDTKNPPKVVDNSIIAPLATGVIAKSVSAEAKEPKSASSKRKMQEIFGSDYEDEIAVSKNQTDDLEQVSDCEEGELDESETGEPSDHEDLPLSGNRIVRMLTPPPQSTRQPVKKETKKGKTGQDCEEGEIVDKKRNKKPKPTEEPATPAAAEDGDEDDILRSAGIGGERRVELISVDEGLPSTFKKLDSGKTRRYRHQGEIKVVEGKGDVKVKEESTEGKRPKRTDMKHYSARRVVERSHGEQQTSSKADRSQHRSRSETKPKEKEYSSKKVKSQRKRPASESSTNSSSSSSRSSSFSSLSSLSPEHRGKGKANHHKRSRSSSTESSSKRRRRKAKHRSRNATEDTSKSRDKKKKSSKKKKKRTKSSKERHKDKKVSSDGKANRTSEADPDGEDIEIPSKAVFASGDKIVVSLHFGSSTPSVSKSSVKKKKRKMDTKDHVSSKKTKTEVPSSRSPSPQEQRKKNSQSTPTASKISSDKSNKKTPSTEVKTEQINPPSPSSSPSTPPLPKSPPPAATKKEESLKLNAASTSESSPRRKETSTNSSESSTSVAGRRNEGNVQGRGILRGRGRGRGMLRSSRGGLRTKPVLIDIETSEVIPLDENRPSAVIVLSDSDHSEEDSKTSLDHLPPLPPLPPPPLPPSALCKPSPSVAEPVKPKVQLLRGVKGSLQKKPGAAVKFSLASKANTLKRLNNPLLQLAEAEEENEEGQQQQQQTSLAVSMDKSPVKTTEATSALSETVKSNEEDNFLINLPLPDGPARSKDIRGSPVKMTTTSAGTKAPSPIFRPPTPPLPPSTSTYDPSFPTNSSSGSSSPSLSSSPLPVVAAINKMHLPPPPLPPPPTPPMMPSFPSLRPGTVLIPPITSLPPPPLPPPPLLAGSPFLVHRPPGGLLSGHYQHPTYPPPPIAGLHSGPPPPILPSPVQHHLHQNQGTVTKVPNITSQPPPVVMQTPPVKSGRPMTPPSPTPSEDIFGLSPDSPVSNHEATSRPQPSSSSKTRPSVKFPPSTVGASSSSKFDSLLQGSNHQSKRINRSPSKPAPSSRSSKPSPMKTKPGNGVAGSASASAPSGGASGPLITQEGLEECPSSAVDLQVKEKFLKKLNRQERVVEEVRLALKPYYTTKRVSKGDYKEILRKCVPKICHTKSGEINPIKIKEMVKGYVKKFRYQKKKDDVVVAP